MTHSFLGFSCFYNLSSPALPSSGRSKDGKAPERVEQDHASTYIQVWFSLEKNKARGEFVSGVGIHPTTWCAAMCWWDLVGIFL